MARWELGGPQGPLSGVKGRLEWFWVCLWSPFSTEEVRSRAGE